MTSKGKRILVLGTLAAFISAAIVGNLLGTTFETCETRTGLFGNVRMVCDWNDSYGFGGSLVAFVTLEFLVMLNAFTASISERLGELNLERDDANEE